MFQSTFLNVIAFLYGRIIWIGSNLQSLFLLWMRLTWGHQFMLSGLKKYHNIQGVVEFFNSIHIPAPLFHAYLVANVEFICGFLILIGFASRLAAIPLGITMMIALRTAHWGALSGFKIFTDPTSLVIQAPYPFLITATLVLLFGPGRISIDAWIKRRVERQMRL